MRESCKKNYHNNKIIRIYHSRQQMIAGQTCKYMLNACPFGAARSTQIEAFVFQIKPDDWCEIKKNDAN